MPGNTVYVSKQIGIENRRIIADKRIVINRRINIDKIINKDGRINKKDQRQTGYNNN